MKIKDENLAIYQMKTNGYTLVEIANAMKVDKAYVHKINMQNRKIEGELQKISNEQYLSINTSDELDSGTQTILEEENLNQLNANNIYDIQTMLNSGQDKRNITEAYSLRLKDIQILIRRGVLNCNIWQRKRSLAINQRNRDKKKKSLQK